MKLERLDSIPDEVDEQLFKSLHTWRGDEDFLAQVEVGIETKRLLLEMLEDGCEVVLRHETIEKGDEKLSLSGFGVLNGLFRHFVPGYRLMVTEGPNEPRRLWVCKEVE